MKTIRRGYDRLVRDPKITSRYVKAHFGIILVLGALYFVQVLTPLRLHPDTVVLLSVAESAAEGGGFLYHRRPTVFPPGYPALLALLIRLHIAHVWLMVAMNIVFLAIGLVAVRSILYPAFFSEQSSVLNVCIFSLLSFVVIKYSTIPLTDTCFFGVAMCSLAVMNSAALRLTLRNMILSIVLVVISLFIRRIGIALIPPLVWIVFFRPEVRLCILRLPIRMKIAATLLLASLSVAVGWIIYATSTLRDLNGVLAGRGVVEFVFSIASFRLKELGEMTINLPSGVLPHAIQHLLPLVGAVTLLLLIGSIGSRRRQLTVLDVFFVSYASVLMMWPFYDPRFWLPVAPLLIAYVGLLYQKIARSGTAKYAKFVFRGHALVYSIMGILTLASSTVLSVSGSRFGDVYPEYRSTYCAAGYCSGGFDETKVDEDGLHLLRAFR
jgi:hypothetical protein